MTLLNYYGKFKLEYFMRFLTCECLLVAVLFVNNLWVDKYHSYPIHYHTVHIIISMQAALQTFQMNYISTHPLPFKYKLYRICNKSTVYMTLIIDDKCILSSFVCCVSKYSYIPGMEREWAV